MGFFDGIRSALGGGPSYTPHPGRYASTRERDKWAKKATKERAAAAKRRQGHRARVFRGDL